MILLDTNVLSEMMRPRPDTAVVEWLDRQATHELWISSITVADLLLGVAIFPEGRRRAELADVVRAYTEKFSQGCASFDVLAAREYAAIVAARRRAGRPLDVQDAQIAAIARSAGMTLATRNVKDFEGIEGLKVVSPWGR